MSGLFTAGTGLLGRGPDETIYQVRPFLRDRR